MNIIEHVESYLGPIDSGWGDYGSGDAVSIARFRDQPVKGLSTYVTLGLSHHILSLPNGRKVRQELILPALDSVQGDEIVSFLLSFSSFILSRHEALLRGEVIGPSNPIVSSSKMNSVYLTIPVIFDDEICTFEGTSPPTVLVWVVPIYEAEAQLIRRIGWERFEDLLEEKDPDLWDFERSPLSD